MMIEGEASRHTSSGDAIRLMTARDLGEVVELEAAARLSAWGVDGYEAELTNEDAIVRVIDASLLEPSCTVNHRIAAFAAARVVMDELHITNIAVRREARRRGLGGLLVRHLMQSALQRGVRWAVLEVRESNVDARRLYERHGFEITGRRHGYYCNPPEDALIMARLI